MMKKPFSILTKENIEEIRFDDEEAMFDDADDIDVDDEFEFSSKDLFDEEDELDTSVPVVDELDDNVVLATRNLNNVLLLSVDEINTMDIVSAKVLIATESAVKSIEEALV